MSTRFLSGFLKVLGTEQDHLFCGDAALIWFETSGSNNPKLDYVTQTNGLLCGLAKGAAGGGGVMDLLSVYVTLK